MRPDKTLSLEEAFRVPKGSFVASLRKDHAEALRALAEERPLTRHAPIIVDASPHEEIKFRARRFALQNATAAFFCAVFATIFATVGTHPIWPAVGGVGAACFAVCAVLALISPKVIR
jgi:hypothetical protein